MAKLFAVGMYDSVVTHWALADREDIARTMPPEDVTLESWWHWKTVCGSKIIGHVEDLPVNCRRCTAALEKAQKTVADLRARFGDGLDDNTTSSDELERSNRHGAQGAGATGR